MAPDHHHGHHHHGGSNIRVAFFLNLGFTLLEIAGGIWINSIAIISDALHDLGDSLALGLAWYFERLSGKGSDSNYSYGYKRFSLLGAVINSVILVVGAVIVLSVAVPRLLHPEEVNAPGMIAFAVLGVVVNGAAVLRLKRGKTMNERVAMLHLLEDVLGWVAVLIGGIVLYFFDLPIIDPLLSVAITGYVLFNVVRNLRQSLKIMLQGTPADFRIEDVKQKLEELPGVLSVHDLHLWTLDGIQHILTLHAVTTPNLPQHEAENLKKSIRQVMAALHISHVTIELESPGQECGLLNCTPGEPPAPS